MTGLAGSGVATDDARIGTAFFDDFTITAIRRAFGLCGIPWRFDAFCCRRSVVDRVTVRDEIQEHCYSSGLRSLRSVGICCLVTPPAVLAQAPIESGTVQVSSFDPFATSRLVCEEALRIGPLGFRFAISLRLSTLVSVGSSGSCCRSNGFPSILLPASYRIGDSHCGFWKTKLSTSGA